MKNGDKNMLNKKRAKQIQPDEVPNLEVPIDNDDVLEEQKQEVAATATWSPGERTPCYVVIRGGLRVSDKTYSSPNEQSAIIEKEFWQKVVDRWPDGTKIEIVQYDKKKYRIW